MSVGIVICIVIALVMFAIALTARSGLSADERIASAFYYLIAIGFIGLAAIIALFKLLLL